MDYYEKRKRDFPNGPIKYVNMAGIIPEIVEERHVRFVMPVAGAHLNHVGVAYAGSMFVLAEVTGANLFMCTYGKDNNYVPILKRLDISYLKPTKSDLVIDISLTPEEAEEKIKEVKERGGKGNYFLDVPIMDIDGNHVAQASINYYAIAPTKDFAAGAGK